MTALSVNLNKIALLRNSREGDSPSVLNFAKMAINAGADGLTVHPRPDQRHIRLGDVYQLSKFVNAEKNTNPAIEFNIEGNPFVPAMTNYPGLLKLIDDTRPDQATLVPDTNDQLTSDHGFDLSKDGERLSPIIDKIKSQGVRCCLFMDPDLAQIKRAHQLGIDRIELYTGPYAASYLQAGDVDSCLQRYQEAAKYAVQLGLGVNAGHDLNLNNLSRFLTIGNIAEVSIGHALTVDALFNGYKRTILDYSKLCGAQ